MSYEMLTASRSRSKLGLVSLSLSGGASLAGFMLILMVLFLKPQEGDLTTWFLVGSALLCIFAIYLVSLVVGLSALIKRKGGELLAVLGIILSVLPGAFLAAGMYKATVTPDSRHFAAESHIDPALESFASRLNRESGIMLSDTTRFNSAAALPNNTIILRFALVNLPASEVDREYFLTQMRPQVIGVYKTFPVFEPLRAQASTVVFQYFGSDGQPVADIKVSINDIE